MSCFYDVFFLILYLDKLQAENDFMMCIYICIYIYIYIYIVLYLLTRATLMSPEKDEILVCGYIYIYIYIYQFVYFCPQISHGYIIPNF